jgi:hypothetical protein
VADLVETPYVLPKPVGSAELLESLRRALHLPSRAGAPRVLVAAERLAGVRALIRELRTDFDVQVAATLDEVAPLAARMKPRAVVIEASSARAVEVLHAIARPLVRFAVIAGEAPLAAPLAAAGVTVARAGELVSQVRAALR